jgi:cysteate synthase
MKLMISQNIPFHPIYDAWKAGSRAMLPIDDEMARKQVVAIDAKVLSNRKPPYPIAGGLYDAMKDTNGEVLIADNESGKKAGEMFLQLEGNDIHPAAAIATATLIDAVKQEKVTKDSIIMLNITGGGEEKFKQSKELYYLKPFIVFDLDPDSEEVKERLVSLY